MEDDEGMQLLRRHHDARDIRDAGGTQQSVNRQQCNKQTSQPGQDWQGLLKEIKDNLTKEEEVSPRCRILTIVEKAARRINALQKRYGEHVTRSDSTGSQLDRIEAGINEIRQKGTPPNPGASPVQG